jgi:histidine triad (HIT) family protein
MAYDPNNVFARILRCEIPCKKVYEDAHALAFHDINPQAPTHVLLVPRRHIASLLDLSPEDDALVGRLVRKARDLAREMGFAERGFRVLFNAGDDAGYSVYHIHLHLLGGRALGWPPG